MSMLMVSIMAAMAIELAKPQTAGATSEEQSAAMASAIANRSQIKTRPTLIKQPKWLRPDAAKEAGEFGTVMLSGIVGEDGRFSEAKVSTSSRSPTLDAAALASVPAILFEPARDADGRAMSVLAKLEVEYLQTNFHGADGLARYQCAQFVRDYDWWYRTWPPEKDDRVFATLRGYATIAQLRSGGVTGDFKAEWMQAIDDCRRSPKRLMLDMLKPHGPLLRSMVN